MSNALITMPGQPKPKKGKMGRPKGQMNVTNKLLKQAQRDIEEMYGERNWHPVVFMMVTAACPTLDMALRLAAAAKAAPYVAAAVKPTETAPSKIIGNDADAEALMNRIRKDLLLNAPSPITAEPEVATADEGEVTEDNEEDSSEEES